MIRRLRVLLADLILDVSQVAWSFMAKGTAAKLRNLAKRVIPES